MTQIGIAAEVPESGRGGGSLQNMESWEERKYYVEFSDTTATHMDARNANGVPLWGAQLTSGTGGGLVYYSLYAMEKEAERTSPTTWTVTVKWMTLKPNDKQPKLNVSQHFWSIVKTLTGVPFEKAIEKDITGAACLNCIGEPYTPPITRLEYDAKLTINLLTNDTTYGTALASCRGALNGSSYTITIGGIPFLFDAFTTKLDNYVLGDQYDQDGAKIASVSLELLYRRPTVVGGTDSWMEKRPNLSFNQSVSGQAKPQPIMNNTLPTSAPISEPRYLDAAGHQIPLGGQQVTKDYMVCSTANFDQLFNVGGAPTLLT